MATSFNQYAGKLAAVAFATTIAATSFAGREVDRLYTFEDSTAGADITLAADTGADPIIASAQSLFAGFEPTAVDLSAFPRPDGVAGTGAQFDGSSFQHLGAERLGTPESSIGDLGVFEGVTGDPAPAGANEYFFILDRGFQFWARPTSLPAEGELSALVADTNNHAALIDSSGNFVMRYDGEDFVSEASTAVNEWSHVMVVRPDRTNPFSAMYVDGVAVALAAGDYTRGVPPNGTVNDVADTAPLVIGAGTEPASGFSQGFLENYTGIIDDVELFVVGFGPGGDFGEFDFGADNGYAAAFAPSNPLDLDGSGAVDLADADVFAANWLSSKTINGVEIGDLTTLALGDFDFSGRVDIADWAQLNAAAPEVAAAAWSQIVAVPEPSAAAMVTVVVVGCLRRRNG